MPHGSLDDMEKGIVAAANGCVAAKKAAYKSNAAPKPDVVKRPEGAPLKRPAADAKPDPASTPKVKIEPIAAVKAKVKLEPKAPLVQSKACAKLVNKIDMRDIFKRLRAKRHEDGMYKNKFCSQAYAVGHARAANEYSATADASTEFGRVQYRSAGALWNATA